MNGDALYLTEREQAVLAALLECHVKHAEPVSSKQLCDDHGLPWSSATVRHALAQLEAKGLLHHPYTSAGKIPTLKAYRFFIQQLLHEQQVDDSAQRELQREILHRIHETRQIVRLTAEVMATVSRLMAVSWVTSETEKRLLDVKLFLLSPRRILLALRTTTQEEGHQTLDLDEPVNASLVRRVAQQVNRQGHGRGADELQTLAQTKWPGMESAMQTVLNKALHLAGWYLNASEREHVVVEGAANLVQEPEFNNVAAARQLLALLEQGGAWLRSWDAPGIQRGEVRIILEEDNATYPMPALSHVIEGVRLADGRKLTLGIVGPRRMAYDRIIPLVKYTAASLAKAAGEA